MSLFVFNNQQKLIKSIPNRDLISVVQNQAINVSDTLFVEIPADIWSNLKEPASYLAVQDPYERFSYHMYKVSKHTTKADTVDIEAIQIGYDELKAYGYIKDRRFNNRPALEAATAVVSGTDWQLGYVDTNLPNVNTNFYYISRLEALSKLIEATGAEVRFRIEISGNEIIAKRIDLYKQLGTFKGKRFAYGSNLLEIIKEEDTSELYTALVGRGKGDEIYTGGFGRRITFADIAWSKASGNPVDKPLGQEFIELPEMTAYYGYPDGEPRTGIVEFGDIEEPEQLLKATYERLVEISRPQVQFKAKVQTTGDMQLGEEVAIIRSDLGFRYKTRVFRVKRDYLNNMFTEVELGDKLTETLASRIKKIDTTNARREEIIIQYIQTAANGKNKIFRGPVEPTEGMMVNDLWYKPVGDGEMEMYQWNGAIWELILSTLDTTKIQQEVDAAIAQAEEAKQAAEDAYTNAVTEAERLVAEQSETFDTKFETETGAIRNEIEQGVTNAVTDANNYTDAQKQVIDNQIIFVEQEVSNVKDTADKVAGEVNAAISDAGFTSLSDTIQNVGTIATNAEQNAQQAISDASSAHGLAQTSISEAQTAQQNSLSALGKADNALGGVSNLDIRVDDVEAELAVKADNTFVTEDGVLTTLSNAITFNATRFSSDMQRIESRVESLSGEINLVILRGSIENRLLYGNEVFPNAPSYSASTNVMGELIKVVGGESFALSKELTGADDRWRISFYDENHNYISRFHPPANTQDIMVAPLNARFMWVSYPVGSKPQIVRGTTFVPYRPNLADQMTTGEMTIFRNEYDEFADKTERRLTAIDSSGGRLETAELLINQTADGVALKADKTTVDALTGAVSSLGTDVGVVAGQVSSKVWMTDINEIEIGGRNYFPVSKLTPKPAIGLDYPGDRVYHFNLEPETEYIISTVSNIAAFRLKNGGEYYRVPTSQTNNKGHKLTTDTTGAISIGFWGNEVDKFINGESLFKIEKGNKATDWTPALEDTDAKIDYIEAEWTQTFDTFSQTVSSIDGRVTSQKQTLDGLETTVQSTQSDLSGTMTLLNQTKQTVDSRTSILATLRTDVNGKATISQFNTLSTTVNGTVTRVGNAEGKITQIETNVSGLQTTVASKASQSQVTQLATGLDSIVKDIAAVESGSENLLPKSNFEDGTLPMVGKFNVETAIVEVEDPYGQMSNVLRMTALDSNHFLRLSGFKLDMDKTYTFSMWVKRVAGGYHSNVTLGIGTDWESGTFSVTGNNWTRVEITAKPGKEYQFIQIDTNTRGVDLYIYKPKLEVGEKATRWSPGSEDNASQSQISQLATNINLRVAKGEVVSQINIEANRTLISSGKILLDGDTYIMGTTFVNDIKAKSLEAVNADVANLRAKILTTDVITSTHLKVDNALVDKLTASVAVVDRFFSKTAVIDNLTAKTLTAITANITSIRSQVLVADAVTSTHLKSDAALINKLFATTALINELTSKTAFINNIKAIDISADRITAGTLNAANVNIINLNVSSIVGLNSTFIQSAWNGINTRINIDGTALTASDSAGNRAIINTSGEIRSTAGGTDQTRGVFHKGRLWFHTTSGSAVLNIGAHPVVGEGVNRGSIATARAEKLVIGRYNDYLNTNPNAKVNPYITLEYGATLGDESNAFTKVWHNLSMSGKFINDVQQVSGFELSVRATSGRLMLGVTGHNTLQVGQENTRSYGNIEMQPGYEVTQASDRRWKDIVGKTETNALEEIKKLSVVDYYWKNGDGEKQFGLIAQDSPFLSVRNEDGYYGISGNKLAMLNLLSSQELCKRIETLEEEIKLLKSA